ncbi:hypothetical protein PK28_17195 (plasmid) [Hymenobacter sp. DG25B]|uniref:hypothetical protein n=1 Tax=Hymenobacter sp. DG25B TaxID=1385664 RepID=UPI000540BD42|nr:hypothetical protein [Hymenobacter sp. DG25B]AIZ65408.1 hypothetical protein PK28_17195 [Hymenobacter sp. DG25B]
MRFLKKVFLGVLLLLVLALSGMGVSILTMDELQPGLQLEASRAASLGGIWLGLYQDQHFSMGYSETSLNTRGTYTFRDDTLRLTADPGTVITRGKDRLTFVLVDSLLLELPQPARLGRINYLQVRLNQFKSPHRH